MCYNVSMGKKRISYPKSPNKNIKFNFWPPNTLIYEKTIQSENAKNTIRLDVKPHKPSEPTIENNLKIDKE